MQQRHRLFLPIAVGLMAPIILQAQFGPGQRDMEITSATRDSVIEVVIARLNARYIFPEKAAEMEKSIRARKGRGEYDRVTKAIELADSLTSHLQSVSRDKHLRVLYSAAPIPENPPRAGATEQEMEAQRTRLRRMNFGFERVERLQGNIGYLDLRMFAPADLAEPTLTAAMNFLAGTDALIIDLRENGGGNPKTVALLCSYLFGDKPVHLNSLHWREGDRVEEFWTSATVAGTKYGEEKQVYVLTSNHTFSGAEEFSYNLKNLKRATIVGETTGGGAHPGGVVRVSDHFGVWVPTGRAVSPVTGTNWEGVGVQPDVPVTADAALETAKIAALKGIIAKTAEPDRRDILQDLLKKWEGGQTKSVQ